MDLITVSKENKYKRKEQGYIWCNIVFLLKKKKRGGGGGGGGELLPPHSNLSIFYLIFFKRIFSNQLWDTYIKTERVHT